MKFLIRTYLFFKNKNVNKMKEIIYKGYAITHSLTGWYSVQTGRYGILKADTLAGIKKQINHAIKAPQYYY